MWWKSRAVLGNSLVFFCLLLSQYINFYVLFMQHLTAWDLLRTFVNESLFTRNSTKGKAPDNDFELEQIPQLSLDDMFPQYIKKKTKNNQAKQKNCCSLSPLKKKTRSSTIRCVVWKCVHLPSISQCFPACSAASWLQRSPWGHSPSLLLSVDVRGVFVVRTTGSPAGGLPLPHFHLWRH